jgi:transposase InsO family protein
MMSTKVSDAERQALIHLLRSEKTPAQAAQELGRSRAWSYKWQERYRCEGWEGLKERSRRPHHIVRKTSEKVRKAILGVRSKLEAEAQQPDELGYIGAHAIRSRLKGPLLPSISTIERILRQADVTKPRLAQSEKKVQYPQIHVTSAHQLTQVDIVPHYLEGGMSIFCFNAIDVVSRFPGGKAYASKATADALDFLVHVWHKVGISEYSQIDNESCFSGGYKHPAVVGKVVRLMLLVGTQPIFSPFYNPESNSYVERFHQDYSGFVWDQVHLQDLSDVRQRSALFFPKYRTSQHHSELDGKSPKAIHFQSPIRKLPAGFAIPQKLPITEGQVHFMRAVQPDRQVLILNKLWAVPRAEPDQGVWATLFLTQPGAKLRIYDAAPTTPIRHCLAEHPFPLKEPVVSLQAVFHNPSNFSRWSQIVQALFQRPALALSTMS